MHRRWPSELRRFNMSDLDKRILRLELIAANIRRNVLDICMQRGGYAGQRSA